MRGSGNASDVPFILADFIFVAVFLLLLVIGAWYICTPSEQLQKFKYETCMTSGHRSEWACRTVTDYWKE